MHADFEGTACVPLANCVDIGCLLAICPRSVIPVAAGISSAISSLACHAVVAMKAGHFP
jgi:hypothetical protein